MKRGIKIALAVVMIASVMAWGLAACAKPAPPAPAPAPPAPAAPAPAPAPPTPAPPPAPPKVKPIILKYADTGAADVANRKAMLDIFDKIEKLTDGRVKHECYWSESLLKAMDLTGGVRVGTADVGSTPSMIYHPAMFPIWQFSTQLFLGGADQWGATRAWMEMAETNPLLKEEIDKLGLIWLGFYGYPTTLMTIPPIAKLEDLKGVTIRAVGATAKWMAAVGATAVPTTFYEIPEAMARGLVQGTEGYVYAHYSWGYYKYCKFLTITPIAQRLIFNSWMNVDTYNKLPPDIQKIYLDTWREGYPKGFVKYCDKELEMQLKAFKDAGLGFIELSLDEFARWKDSCAFVIADYYGKMDKIGVDGRKLVAQYEELYKKYESKK